MTAETERAANASVLRPANRAMDDFYATPLSAIEQLLQVELFEGTIWEPACGDGAISKALEGAGYEVVSTDLVNRNFGQYPIDFLLERRSLADNIITNPPFNLAVDFVRHAITLATGKVAMLLKIGFIEGPTKADLHAKLARVWVIRRRVTFLKNGEAFSRSNGKGGIHTYAWFVWDPAHTGAPVVGWLEGEPCK